MREGLTQAGRLDHPWPSFNRIPPVLQRSIIVELSPVAGLAATRFGMIIGTGTTTTMPTRAGTG